MSELIKEMLEGNPSAFSEIVSTYEKKVYNYLYRLCGNRDDALDLAQETFIKAYSNIDKFNTAMDFRPWIYRIAHNNYINHVKGKKEHANICDREFPDHNTPESIVVERDNIKIIDSIIKSLPYEYRSIFLLRAIDNLSFKEIGSILKISETNARMRYLRVRRKIGECLKGGDLL